MKIFRTIGSWWKRTKPDRRYPRTVFLESRRDVPDAPAADTLYVVGVKRAPKWLIFDCPCGRGHRLDVNLMRARNPFWRLSFGLANRVSASPSLWVADDICDSHFWLKNSAVYFVRANYGDLVQTNW